MTMDRCHEQYEEWLSIQNMVDTMDATCERLEEAWFETFLSALANIKQPEQFLKELVKSHRAFQGYAECQAEHDHTLTTSWQTAMDSLWDCVGDHAYRETLPQSI